MNDPNSGSIVVGIPLTNSEIRQNSGGAFPVIDLQNMEAKDSLKDVDINKFVE